MSSWGIIIKTRRKEEGWSRKELAEKVKTASSYVRMIEQGEVWAPIDFRVVRRFCEVLGLDYHFMLALTHIEFVIPHVELDSLREVLKYFRRMGK